MAQYKVQVIDEAGNLIANKTVEATDYVDACAEVVRQHNKLDGATDKPFTGGESTIGDKL